MIMKFYKSTSFANAYFSGFIIINIFLSLLSFLGFYSGVGFLSTVFGILYLLLVSLLSMNNKFRNSPFAVLFIFYTIVFFNIPAVFVLIKGVDYIFGDGLASVPKSQMEYLEALWISFFYLFIFWLSVWLGIVSSGLNKLEIKHSSPLKIKNSRIIFLAIFVLIITWLDNQEISNVYLSGAEKIVKILPFIFFDHAFLLLSGMIIFFKINDNKLKKYYSMVTHKAALLFIGFVALNFISGSKAAIISVYIIFLLMPFAYSRNYTASNIVNPSIKILFILCIISPLLFYLALVYRMNLSSGIQFEFNSYFNGLFNINSDIIFAIFDQILYRISWGGFDRFILLSHPFLVESYDQAYAYEFLTYIYKNTINLLLPGTPFPESYAPSSQIYPDALLKNMVSTDLDVSSLIISFNTQPYTIFGVFMIIFGITSPFFLFLFTLSLIFFYKKNINFLFKATILYFWYMSLASYGIDAVIGNSAHILISMWSMYMLLAIRFKSNAVSLKW